MKKMRKAKIITALSLTVVMLAAMTGIAAADQINVYEPNTFVAGVGGTASGTAVASINLVPGGAVVIKDLEVWSFNQPANTMHTLNTSVAPLTGPGVPGDIMVRYSEKTMPCAVPPGCGAFAPALRNWTQDMGAQGAGPTVWESLDIEFSAAAGVASGNTYQVQITDDNGLPLTVQVTLVTTTIPEFATIAIPVAGILGLLFFFNHRKHKKE